MINELETLELAKNGNEQSFNELIDYTITKIKPAIFNSFNSLSKEDFEDALQAATVKAWQKMGNFRGDSLFSTWFFIIFKNEILNVLKSASRIKKHEIKVEDFGAHNEDENRTPAYDSIVQRNLLDDAVDDTAQSILQKQEDLQEYRKMLDAVLLKLKPSHREIIQMVFEQEKSYKEVSETLSIPIGTVMSRLYFARRNAQKLIEQYAQRNDIQLTNMGECRELTVTE